jgi:hypothetical protein
MLIIPDCAPANLQSLPDSIIDRAIRNNDISSLAERRDNTRDGGESLRINNTILRAKARSNVRLGLHMNILRAVELRRATRSNAICPESLDSLLLDLLIANEVIEIIGREIRHSPAIRELDFRARRSVIPIQSAHYHPKRIEELKPNNHRRLLILRLLERSLRRNKWFRSPLINQIINLLYTRQSPSHPFSSHLIYSRTRISSPLPST